VEFLLQTENWLMANNLLLSLFCGCGSFDHGFSSAGFKIGLALDISKDAVESYNVNRLSRVAEVCDLYETNARAVVKRCIQKSRKKPFTGVIGGAPCQSFSHGNVHKRANDIRHSLPKAFASVTRAMKHQFGIEFFVFENVTGLRSGKHEKVLEEFKTDLCRHFTISETILDAVNYGVPQRRPRLFVVGINKQKYPGQEFKFPCPSLKKQKTVRDAIGNLPAPIISIAGTCSRESRYHPNHRAMAPKSRRFLNGTLHEGDASGRSFRVLSWDRPSWTVAYGNREVHVHPSGKRRLSVFEAMILQGFPKAYKLCGTLSSQIRQVSDAVPNQVGYAIAKSLKKQLYST
jgi:DNA (cytosine-5)-methyltransferase 1